MQFDPIKPEISFRFRAALAEALAQPYNDHYRNYIRLLFERITKGYYEMQEYLIKKGIVHVCPDCEGLFDDICSCEIERDEKGVA